MVESSKSTSAEAEFGPPPPLPDRLVTPWPVGLIGTGLWLLAFVVLLICAPENDVWVSTTGTGFVLGVLGMGLMAWQRSAGRRGSRGAQSGI